MPLAEGINIFTAKAIDVIGLLSTGSDEVIITYQINEPIQLAALMQLYIDTNGADWIT